MGNLENDCIAILNWCYRNQSSTQSYRILERELNIPIGTLHRIIKGFEYFGDAHWAIEFYARRYGYTIQYVGREGQLIFVDKRRPWLENEILTYIGKDEE
jgi:hypothetical protein|tara:strand:- start:1677 stop:1976 length:300 start_codon:yes stop_codon:yes gene_type:complete